MKKNFHALGKRALALLIVLTMCVSLLQVTAFAAPGDETTAEPVGDVVQQPKETTEPETKDPVEETTEPETKEPAEETTEPETKAPVEETAEPETKEPVEETTEPEIKDPVENATESETKAPVKDVTETKTEPVVVMKPAAPAAPVLTTPAGAISYIVNALTTYKVGDKCPECLEGTVVADKSNPNHLICDKCAKFSFTIQGTEPEPEKCKHENGFDGYDRCVDCKALNPNHKHSYDETGKCVCGDQHEHDWKYTPEHYEYFTHTKYCSSCGEKVKEACTKEKVYDPWAGQYVYKCTLCNYWSEPVDEHHWSDKWEPDGKGSHTQTCTDTNCGKTRTEECKLEAYDDGMVRCSVCGWVKYDDGTPGGVVDGDKCPSSSDGQHTYGTIGVSVDGEHHKLVCVNKGCSHANTAKCEWSILKVDGKVVAHYCTVCGNQKSIRDDGDGQYCTDLDGGHKWCKETEVLSEDGKSVLTTMTCSKCGAVKITDICNSPSQVVVHYKYEDGKTAHEDLTQAVIKGMDYSITSPTIEGYKPDCSVVSGTCDGKGVEVTVTYYKADVKTYTLTVNYQYPGGQEVFPTQEFQFKEGEEYNVKALPLDGYTTDYEAFSGKMFSDDVVTFKYEPIQYSWIIHYFDKQGNQLATDFEKTYTIEDVKVGLSAPENPIVPGYKIDSAFYDASGKDLRDREGKVVYEPITYTWTIMYVDENGDQLFDPSVAQFTVGSTLEGVQSPVKEGYSADIGYVARPTNDLKNHEVIVTYTRSFDYGLTIVHRYLDRDGNVDEQTVDGGKYRVGDTYDTKSIDREGYTLSKTPENASGVFGTKDMTVIYEYTANPAPVVPTDPTDPTDPTPPSGGGGGGTSTNPPEEPNPPIDIPDPDVPTVEPDPDPDDPQEPGDDVIIDDPNVPLAPGPDIPDVDIDDPDVPMTNKPTVPAEKNPVPQPTATGLTEIEDEDVPLAEVPQTGDNTGLWIAAVILAACGLVTLGKKREDA